MLLDLYIRRDKSNVARNCNNNGTGKPREESPSSASQDEQDEQKMKKTSQSENAKNLSNLVKI